MKGKFIVIDGTDGSGKATQTNILVENLRKKGFKVEIADFPQYGQRSASLVEDYLNGKFGSAKEVGPYRASIFYACDRYAAASKINTWLDEGKIVVANRYTSSNMGHQAGKIKDKKERDKFLDWLEDLEFNIFGIPKPDITMLLYVPPKDGQGLVNKKLQTTIDLFQNIDYQKKITEQKDTRSYLVGKTQDIHEKDIKHLREASKAYKYVANKYSWTIIDCTSNGNLMTIEEIHKLVWSEVQEAIK